MAAIEVKVPRKRTHSVVEAINQDYFESLKDSKKTIKKSISSKVTVSQAQQHFEAINDDENSVSTESHKRKEDNTSHKKADAIDTLERLPALDEVEGDDEDSLSKD